MCRVALSHKRLQIGNEAFMKKDKVLLEKVLEKKDGHFQNTDLSMVVCSGTTCTSPQGDSWPFSLSAPNAVFSSFQLGNSHVLQTAPNLQIRFSFSGILLKKMELQSMHQCSLPSLWFQWAPVCSAAPVLCPDGEQALSLLPLGAPPPILSPLAAFGSLGFALAAGCC